MPILRLPTVRAAFDAMNDALLALETATRAGTTVVFGLLGGGALPYAEKAAGACFVLAFQALPIVLVMSALSALLFHWRVLPFLVRLMSMLLEKTFGVGGAVGMSTAANVFVGMVEAPLLVRPYLARVSRGELFVILSAGRAGVAGTVMALYAGIIGPRLPDALGGFANLGSLGIMIGGLTTMVPERRQEILSLGPRTIVAGTLATLSCGCIAGVLV